MEEKQIEEIGKKLAVFDFGRLQELLTLFSVLEREELTLEDVREFIETVKELQRTKEAVFNRFNKERKKLWNKNTRKCPLCKKPLLLRAVRIPKGKGNVKGYTCHWFCSSEECLFEKYTKEDFKELYEKIMSRR